MSLYRSRILQRKALAMENRSPIIPKVIFHDKLGIYLGNHEGTGRWALKDDGHLPATAPTVLNETEATDLISQTVAKPEEFPSDYRLVEVAAAHNTPGSATPKNCGDAALPEWVPGVQTEL